MRNFIKYFFFRLFDLLSVPFVFVALPLLRFIRKHGIARFPYNRKMFSFFGVIPIRDHYYEPRFNYEQDLQNIQREALLIDLNIKDQISRLQHYSSSEELLAFDKELMKGNTGFYLNNPNFGPGDSELYYLLIRNLKPKRIIEIGSGFSTMICLEAIKKNREEGHPVEIICIEPFEQDWLDANREIRLIRKPVESLDLDLFRSLEENDILFIDSSHVIRPGNDVLFEYLHILPVLKKGVLIHIHDIFTPLHYRFDWLKDEYRLWNEQYLLEAFLYYNESFEVMFSLNHLAKSDFESVKAKLPNLKPDSEPSSFWIRKQ